MLGQWCHQLILRKAIESLGGSVELGTTPIGIEQDENGVDVKLQKTENGMATEESVRFKYVVGADGAHSKWKKLSSYTLLLDVDRCRTQDFGNKLRWRDAK
jgi:flavin-dependent dehydrogenase